MDANHSIDGIMGLAQSYANSERDYYDALSIDVGVEKAEKESLMAENDLRNVLFALLSKISQLEAANKEVLVLREALRRAIDFVTHAEVSSGVCCCGDSIDGHGDPMETGHSPRDMWDYAAEGFVKETQKVLDGNGVTHSDTALAEWHDKTEWLRKDLQPHELGKHLADVLRERCETLKPSQADTDYWIVWNADKTEGFVSADEGLAYEVRKASDTNCFDATGKRSDVGVAFCEAWGDGDCTMERLEVTQVDAERWRYARDNLDMSADTHVWLTTDSGQKIHVTSWCRKENERAVDSARGAANAT